MKSSVYMNSYDKAVQGGVSPQEGPGPVGKRKCSFKIKQGVADMAPQKQI